VLICLGKTSILLTWLSYCTQETGWLLHGLPFCYLWLNRVWVIGSKVTFKIISHFINGIELSWVETRDSLLLRLMKCLFSVFHSYYCTVFVFAYFFAAAAFVSGRWEPSVNDSTRAKFLYSQSVRHYSYAKMVDKSAGPCFGVFNRITVSHNGLLQIRQFSNLQCQMFFLFNTNLSIVWLILLWIIVLLCWVDMVFGLWMFIALHHISYMCSLLCVACV
jgi:hypothetical protein